MSDKAQFEPANSVIARFGSASEVARVLDLDKSTICRWTMPKEKRGTEGKIPRKYWEPLLTAARQRKIRLSLTELVALNK